MSDQPKYEPCGCSYGSVDFPTAKGRDEPFTEEFMECLECGAVWTTKEDNAFHDATRVHGGER